MLDKNYEVEVLREQMKILDRMRSEEIAFLRDEIARLRGDMSSLSRELRSEMEMRERIAALEARMPRALS